MKNTNREVLSKKSPDGRYMIDISDSGETCNGVKVCKVLLENRMSRDTRIIDFPCVLYSRRKELYWGSCSLFFFFYSFEKSTLKEFLVICDIPNGRYARLDISKGFGVFTSTFPVLGKRLVISKVKSNFSRLEWIDYN